MPTEPPPETKKRKADDLDASDAGPSSPSPEPGPSRTAYKRACKREVVVSNPVLACDVARKINGRNDQTRLETHLKAIAAHKEKYEARIQEVLRKEAGGDASETHAKPAHKAKVTEAVGEHEATLHMLQKYPDAELLWGFSAGTGIDQVWAVGMPDPTSYLIVEAKGPGASLSTSAAKGDQMSKMWVQNSLREVLASASSTDDEKAHARAMLRAMATGPPPQVRGVVIEAQPSGGAREVACPDNGIYHRTTSP